MTNSLPTFLLVIALAHVYFLLGCAPAIHEKTSKLPISIHRDIPYGPGEANKYDLFLPAHTPKGAMLFIHGGSWTSGDKQQLHGRCQHFAEQGFLTATMDYTLATPNKPIPYFQMLEEISACLAHVKISAENHGIRLKRIALSGYSAGGHLAMLYAFTRAEQSPLPIAFVFSQVGPSTFEYGTWAGKEEQLFPILSLISGSPETTMEQFLNGEKQDIIKALSPALNVNDNTVPTVCAYAMKDELVSYEQAERLVQQLEKHHIPYHLITYKNSGHGLENDPGNDSRFDKAVLDFADKYL